MAESKRYKVIVSNRAKRMLGTHIRFMAQVNKEAATAKKKEIMTAMRLLSQMPQRFPFFEEPYITPNKYNKITFRNRHLQSSGDFLCLKLVTKKDNRNFLSLPVVWLYLPKWKTIIQLIRLCVS